MAPKKGTKAYKAEYIMAYWGINPRTFTVDSVWQSRDGTLHGPNGGTSYIRGSGTAQGEIIIVWGLTDTFGVPTWLLNEETTNARIEELKKKAAALKEEAARLAAGPTRTGPVSDG